MDGERAVENDGSRHTVPDEIMNSSTPLHCLERDIAERVHAKVQREIGEHDETSCEAEPSDGHLVEDDIRIYHLTPSPGRDAARVLEGRERKPVDVRLGPESDINRQCIAFRGLLRKKAWISLCCPRQQIALLSQVSS